MTNEQRILAIKIGLTATALEFFGPTIRDIGPSHALHPDWVGHARVHLIWLLGFMFLSGLANVWLVWFRGADLLGNLRLSALWQSANLGGFWIACFTSDLYDGEIAVPGVHTHILGYDENVFAFSILSVVMAAIWFLLFAAGRDADAVA